MTDNRREEKKNPIEQSALDEKMITEDVTNELRNLNKDQIKDKLGMVEDQIRRLQFRQIAIKKVMETHK